MSISNETLYVVTPSAVERWNLSKERINVNDSLAAAFSANLVRKCPATMAMGGDYGMAGIAMIDKYEVWSVRVNQMSMEAPYALVEGVHVPVFDSGTLPVMPMKWKPPSTMKLVLGITVFFHASNRQYYTGDHYLVAYDNSNRMWRLPLSNLYEDCKLCHGQAIQYTSCTLDAVKRACELFSRSRWNADLYKPHQQGNTSCLFRFKPTADGFEQQHPLLAAGKDWTSVCEKVAVEKLNSIVQPV